MKYGRLRTSDGQYVSSCWIKQNNKIARNNYSVQVNSNLCCYFDFIFDFTFYQ